jgi:glycosyltransferase involved in cell wall biosynthesis
MTRRLLRVLGIGLSIIRSDGLLKFMIAGLQYVDRRRSRVDGLTLVRRRQRFDPPVLRDDVLKADFVNHPHDRAQRNPRRTRTLSWVMSPPGNGGGHQNIFRFIDYLADAGYTNHIYLYSAHHPMTLEEAEENVSHYSTTARHHFHQWEDEVLVDSDIVFATGWETAYPVFNARTDGAKFYFVQDLEPLFYPVGSISMLAENTYKFGFHGITAGGWLKHKLETDYGMVCDSYDFGADASLYKFRNHQPRKEVFFYARPVTERRAFEVGILALELFHRARPDYTINLAGWDVSSWDVPFPHVNHKSLKLRDLPDLYDKCAAAIVLSLTNLSLLPLELLACGVIPVVNDGDNNRMVSNNPYIHYVPPTPQSLADELVRLVEREDLPQYAAAAAESVTGDDWADAGAKVVSIVTAVSQGPTQLPEGA